MSLPDKLELRAVTPMRQSFEMGCGPTSVAMALSGLGIITTEQALAEAYFPSALLPSLNQDTRRLNPDSGLHDSKLIEGIVDVVEGMGLQKRVNVDVFDANLFEYTFSSEQGYIIEVQPRSMKELGTKFRKGEEVKEFYQSLETLSKKRKIKVYTANARLMRTNQGFFGPSKDTIQGFYTELADFISRGHIVGPHGGMTAHIRALDGTRTETPYGRREIGFLMLDPNGQSNIIPISSLVMAGGNSGVRGDTFDYLFRLSPKEVLSPQQFGIRGFLGSLKSLLAR